MKKKLDYNAIQAEIHEKYSDLKSETLDVYKFTGYISKKYFEPVDENFGVTTKEDPYVDLLFAMLEINGIELY